MNFALSLKRIACLGAISAAVVISGCKKESGTASSGEGGATPARTRKVHKAPDGVALKLAFVTNNATEFWKVAEAGVRKYEREAGNITVDVKMPASSTVQEQNQIVESLMAQNYNGIAISPIAPTDQTRLLNKVAEATNLITQDSDAPKSNRLLYIGTENYSAGKALGEQIVKLMPDGGKIAVFVGTFSADNARERLRGIEDAIKGKNITVAAKKEDNKNQGKARSNVDDVLTAQGDVTMLVGLWAYNGPQIAASLEGNGKAGKVLAAVFDDEADTLAAVERGTIACTVVQRQFDFGYESAKMLHELATKGEAALPKEELKGIPVEVITKDTVVDFRKRMMELKSGGGTPATAPTSAPVAP